MVRMYNPGLMGVWAGLAILSSSANPVVKFQPAAPAGNPPAAVAALRNGPAVNAAPRPVVERPAARVVPVARPGQPDPDAGAKTVLAVLEDIQELLHPFSLSMLVVSSMMFVLRSAVCKKFPRRCVCPLIITSGAVLLSIGLVARSEVLFVGGLIVVSVGHFVQAGVETARVARNLYTKLRHPRPAAGHSAGNDATNAGDTAGS